MVAAENALQAEQLVIARDYYLVLDDDLADLMDVEEITDARILADIHEPETCAQQYERIRMK